MRDIVAAILGIVLLAGTAQADGPPQRVVSAGGDLTEIIYALDAQDRLVGVDSTSNYPATAKDLAQIGYVRRVAPEGILSLKPDMILGAYDMGPPAAIGQLKAAGVKVALAPRGDLPGGIPAKIRFVGEALGLSAKAEMLASKVAADLKRAMTQYGKAGPGPKVIFILSLGEGGVLVGGRGSSAEAIIQMAGGRNAATGFDGYKPMSREAILASQPEVLLMMESSVQRYGGIEAVLKRPELASTPAALNGKSIAMDGMLLLGFGPRTPSAVARLGEYLHR
tara:strand:+ start:6435 stop:7274 length:840 start_codon:yes stop_codon:yes gene_type:complete